MPHAIGIPFGVDAFFSVFAQYNEALWPAQLAAYVAAFAALAALFRPSRASTMVIGFVLVAMWMANGAGYHLMFFTRINPAAYLFGALFIVEAVLLAVLLLQDPHARFAVRSDGRSKAGLALIGFSAIVYPAWSVAAGHAYPAMPVLGLAPCPTTIFTIGLLIMARPRPDWRVLTIPIVWALIGGSAAWLLDVPQDTGLWIAAAVAVWTLVQRERGHSVET